MALFSKLSGVHVLHRRNKETAGESRHKAEEIKQEVEEKHPELVGDDSNTIVDTLQGTTENIQEATLQTQEQTHYAAAVPEENDDHMYMHEESYEEKEGMPKCLFYNLAYSSCDICYERFE